MFGKLHDGAIKSVDTHRSLRRRVHRDTTNLADISQGKNIGNGCRIVLPYLPKIWKVANHIGVLVTAICNGAQDVWTAADISQNLFVLENRDG